jgi:DNA-binding NtrC family response regulator
MHSPQATDAARNDTHKGNSAESILKLRRLISDLINEVNSLDHHYLPITEAFLGEDSNSIRFYEEVKRFEIALINAALRKSHGHQLQAARFLNLNPSTLNAKIKQYGLRHLVM